MNKKERNKILEDAKNFFRERIAESHIKNTSKLADITEFNINPFLNTYLSHFAFGNSTPESIAKSLIYPRALGTSITTTFGTQIQYFCNEVLKKYVSGSTTSGIDIEFTDAVDGRHKYCQVKAGPQTINKDDVTTIKNHFKSARNLGRTNDVKIKADDCFVGILYGTHDDLSANYKKIEDDYSVYIGQEFWYHVTGDSAFYYDLIDAFGEVAEETDGTDILKKAIAALASEIARRHS